MTRPVLVGTRPSFGFGDRIGLATPGHVAALRRAGGDRIVPVFAQQSIREMTRTARTPDAVMADAERALDATGYDGDVGADADHLKSEADIDATAAAGFVMFTLDPSDFVDARADSCGEAELRALHDEVRGEVAWVGDYRELAVELPTGRSVRVTEEQLLRCGVKYGRAVNRAIELARHVEAVQTAAGRPFELELSVDETDHPTSLAEHWIVAHRCREVGVQLAAIAPRFVGDFEKGVDFIGSLDELQPSLEDHAAIAELLGGYKLSLHSGSDKLSMYPLLARATRGRFHVKTAGTSYLEAVRVAAQREPELFRRIVAFARDRYETDRATYHVHAELDQLAGADDVANDAELEALYLGCWAAVEDGAGFTGAGRQVLHTTFGSVLTDPGLGAELRACLEAHADLHERVLDEHFGRHLEALRRGM